MKLLKSKKFQVAIAGIVAIIDTNYFPNIDQAELAGIVVIILGYLLGQGMADFGKEAK